MANIQNPPKTKEPSLDLAWEGLRLGGKAGFIIAIWYAIAGILIIEFLGQGVGLLSFPSEQEGGLRLFVFVTIVTIIMIFFFAITPAVIIGALTGMYIGQLAKLTGARLPRYLFLMLCISLCLVVIILIHVFFKIPIVLSFQNSTPPTSSGSLGVYETYPFAIGIPSLIYLVMGIWGGGKLYSKVSTHENEQV